MINSVRWILDLAKTLPVRLLPIQAGKDVRQFDLSQKNQHY